MFVEKKGVSVQGAAVAGVDVHPVHVPRHTPAAAHHLLGNPGGETRFSKSKVKEIKYALYGGACEAKTLQPLIGEASRLFSSLPSLKVGAAQVLNLGTTFGILKTRVESEVSISLGQYSQRANPCRTDSQ